MTTDPAGTLAGHLALDCTTLCHCWRLERTDGLVMGFTDHDRAIAFEGVDHVPETGLSASETVASLDMSPGSAEVEGALSSDRLSENDIDAGRFDGATVETFLVNWRDPAERMSLRKAVIGRITRADGRFLAELESPARALDRPNGRHLRRVCDAELGDARCGADVTGGDFNAAGSVIDMPAPATIRVNGMDSFDPGWFAQGVLEWGDGSDAGRRLRIVDHRRDGEAVLLVLEGDGPAAQPGTSFAVRAGCDRRFVTCREKFGNSINFRGFPHLPGNDAAYGYVTDGGNFDGGVLVP
jgi:uncharacterized phage protein (TIGR02218 family)